MACDSTENVAVNLDNDLPTVPCVVPDYDGHEDRTVNSGADDEMVSNLTSDPLIHRLCILVRPRCETSEHSSTDIEIL